MSFSCEMRYICWCTTEGHGCCIYCDKNKWCNDVCTKVEEYVMIPNKVVTALEPSYEQILTKIHQGKWHDEYNNLFAVGRFLINKLHAKILVEGEG